VHRKAHESLALVYVLGYGVGSLIITVSLASIQIDPWFDQLSDVKPRHLTVFHK
jgi:hypothetical protein